MNPYRDHERPGPGEPLHELGTKAGFAAMLLAVAYACVRLHASELRPCTESVHVTHPLNPAQANVECPPGSRALYEELRTSAMVLVVCACPRQEP